MTLKISPRINLAAKGEEKKKTLVEVGDLRIGGEKIIVIAGPCSVETRDQLMEVANSIRNSGASMLRGGAFKPRTLPYSFQGLGEEGLKLLAEARKKYGLPIVTEVMSPETVDIVAHYADILQVGARNMQNYPLLKRLGETQKPILLKRGLSATIEEWLSAAEYVLAGGKENVILCERGIRTFEKLTRFTLDITAVPLIKEISSLPIIVDPSHGTGHTALISPMARAAVAAVLRLHPLNRDRRTIHGPHVPPIATHFSGYAN